MKTIATFVLATTSLISQSQITLDHTYEDMSGISLWLISETEMKYWDIDNGLATLYNLDHTVDQSFSVNPESGIQYLTRTLFDCDETNLEYLAAFPQILPDGIPGRVEIRRTDGTLLFEADTVNFYHMLRFDNLIGNAIFPTLDGTKMKLPRGMYPDTWVEIYGLCGDLPMLSCLCDTGIVGISENEIVKSIPSSYPNPTTNSIRIDYTLPEGVNVADLKIFDMQGNIVKTVQVGKAFDHVLLDLSALAPGTYLYQVGEQAAQQLLKL